MVTKARSKAVLALILMGAAGWLLSAYTVLTSNELRLQEAIIRQADVLLQDKLYVRAAAQYLTALDTYHTERNLEYETELLNIYRDGGMMNEYYGLIEDRIEGGRAAAGEYLALAQMYVDGESAGRAIPVLQQGIEAYQDAEMIQLYESIRYAYRPTSTVYTQMAMPSSDWYIPVYNGTAWGYVGDNGRTLLDFQYEDASCFAGSYAAVKLDGVYTLIDKNGYWNAVDKNGLEDVTQIAGKRIVGVKNGTYGIYTNTFTPLGTGSYENAVLSDNGLTAVRQGGKWAVLDEELQEVTGYSFTDIAVNSRGQAFASHYSAAADESGYFLINEKGEPCFETRFAGMKGMEGGLAAAMDSSGLWGFTNEKGELVVACQYEDAFSFSDDLAAVKYAGKWGYINRYGTMVIEPQFAQAFPFLEGRALVTDELGNYRILELMYYSQTK